MMLHTTTAWYDSDVDNEFINYSMPQEHGNHSNCRKLDMENGLSFTACKKFEINVSRYDSMALTQAKHTDELAGNGCTNVRIDYKNSGVGSNSCGPKLLEKYRLSEKEIHFEFCIK
jgi:beta-galactosidase